MYLLSYTKSDRCNFLAIKGCKYAKCTPNFKIYTSFLPVWDIKRMKLVRTISRSNNHLRLDFEQSSDGFLSFEKMSNIITEYSDSQSLELGSLWTAKWRVCRRTELRFVRLTQRFTLWVLNEKITAQLSIDLYNIVLSHLFVCSSEAKRWTREAFYFRRRG